MIPIGTWIKWMTVNGPRTGEIVGYDGDSYVVSLDSDRKKSVIVHHDSVKSVG